MADESSTEKPARVPASAAQPEERNPAGEKFELARWIRAGVLEDPPHVIDGAATLAGWDEDTKLTRQEVRRGISAFLAHVPNREE